MQHFQKVVARRAVKALEGIDESVKVIKETLQKQAASKDKKSVADEERDQLIRAARLIKGHCINKIELDPDCVGCPFYEGVTEGKSDCALDKGNPPYSWWYRRRAPR